MPKTPNVEAVLKILQQSYHDLPIPLRHRSAFELLVAVILSAQNTDERVNKVTPHLFPKDRPLLPEDLLIMGADKVKAIIYPCGYYNSKTKALMGCAEALKGGRDVPGDFEELRKLPGVGAKTAQVVLAQWFGQDAFPVDTHVHRVCNRIGLADSGTNRDKTERQVKAIVPQKYWSDLHLQLIYHGRQICTARKPKCGQCPLYEVCQWKDKVKFS